MVASPPARRPPIPEGMNLLERPERSVLGGALSDVAHGESMGPRVVYQPGCQAGAWASSAEGRCFFWNILPGLGLSDVPENGWRVPMPRKRPTLVLGRPILEKCSATTTSKLDAPSRMSPNASPWRRTTVAQGKTGAGDMLGRRSRAARAFGRGSSLGGCVHRRPWRSSWQGATPLLGPLGDHGG